MRASRQISVRAGSPQGGHAEYDAGHGHLHHHRILRRGVPHAAFGHSRLMRLQHEAITAEAAATRTASPHNDAAHTAARERYNRAVTSFPTNLVAMVTGFTRRN